MRENGKWWLSENDFCIGGKKFVWPKPLYLQAVGMFLYLPV